MKRTVTLLFPCWAFSVPMLCTSGILIHPCACDAPDGCDHETECSDDPCNTAAIVQSGSVRTDALPELIASPLDDAPLVAEETTLCRFTVRIVEPPGQANRPFADSDIPLLI